MTDPALAVAPRTEVVPQPVRRPLSHAFWFALLLATALTLGGAAFAVGAYRAATLPETVVRQYFAALQDGDAAAALGYGGIPDGSRALLTAGVLAAQNAAGPIGAVTVRQVRTAGDTALVDVTYTVDLPSGPDQVRDTVSVLRHGSGWRLERSAIAVTLNPDGGSSLATFAGSAVPAGDFLMFPGALPVRYATPNLELQPSSAVLRFVDAGTVDVQAAVTPEGERAILPALRTILTACLAGTATVQPLCPVPDPLADVPGSLRGTLTAVDPNTLGLTVGTADGKIDIVGTVGVRASYQQLDQNNMATAQHTTATTLRAYCFATAPRTIDWTAP